MPTSTATTKGRSRWGAVGVTLALLVAIIIYWGFFGKGVVRVATGNRELTEVAMAAELFRSDDPEKVWRIGAMPYIGGVVGAREWTLPRGDYFPHTMWFRFGRLEFTISNNDYSDGALHGAVGRTYPIRIRKWSPFVFDFSNQPDVMFASPAKDQTFRPGDKVEVEAVLVDPVLNTRLRSLHDASRCSRNGEATAKNIDSLNPKVTILDGLGRKVAEGTMPFG